MNDVVKIILSQLSLRSLLNMRAVNKYYHNYVTNRQLDNIFRQTIKYQNIKKFAQINGGKGIKNVAYNIATFKNRTFNITHLERVPNIESIQIINKSMDDNHLKNLTNLSFLMLSKNAKISGKSLSYLTNLDYLRSMRNLASESIGQLTKLRTLWVDQRIKANCLSKLTNLTKLDSFELRFDDIKSLTNLTEITPAYYSENNMCDGLVHMPMLKAMAIKTHSQVTNENLRKLTMLQKLDIFDDIILNDQTCMHLTNLISLDFCRNNIDNGSIKYLTKLQSLTLHNCNSVRDDGLSHLTNITALRLTEDHRIFHLHFLTKLTHLFLHRHNNVLSDNVPLLTQLKSLSLICNTKVEDGHIQNLTGLTELNLNSNKKITCDGIKNLTNLKDLIFHNSKISLDDIHKVLPHLSETIQDIFK